MTKIELIGYLMTAWVCSKYEKAVYLVRADQEEDSSKRLVLMSRGYGAACEESMAFDLLGFYVK